LARCLAAIEQQKRSPDQLIVVHRHDDAETADFLRFEHATTTPFTIVTVSRPGQVAALNAGLRSAFGDIVAITDDDAAPRPLWLRNIEQHFRRDPRIGGVGGRDYIDGGRAEIERRDVGIMQFCGRLIGNHHRGTGIYREVHFLKGANMSYRSTAIGKQLFDERLLGSGAQVHNDLAFSLAIRRAGWKLVYDPEVAVDHYPSDRFDEDQRATQTFRSLEDRAFNETLTVLEHLPASRHILFWLWAFLLGSRVLPGLAQFIRFPQTEPPAWRRFIPVLRARRAAALLLNVDL